MKPGIKMMGYEAMLLTLPILSPFSAPSVNHIFPSGPKVMASGALLAVGTGISWIMVPFVSISPILLPAVSVNNKLPFEPVVIPAGPLFAVGIENSVIVPFEVILPILLPDLSVNHKFPFEPVVIPAG